MTDNIKSLHFGILSFFENIPTNLILVNKYRKIININKTALKFIGKKKAQVLGLYIGNALGCINAKNDMIQTCGNGSNCKACVIGNLIKLTFEKQQHISDKKSEFKIQRNNKQEIYQFEVSSSYLKIQNNDYVLISINNTTTVNFLEKELKTLKEKAANNRKKISGFYKHIDHETRSQLNNIVGLAELLNKMEIEKKPAKEFINEILERSNRLNELISDILIVSKIILNTENVEKNTTNLNELFEDFFETYKETAQQKGIELKLKTDLPDNNCFVELDEEKIRRIFTYLIRNAIKYTNSGYIRFGYLVTKNELLHFFVKDTGTGIPQKMQDLVFDPYYQLSTGYEDSYNASGLGLAISKEYIRLMRGRIWIESEENKGTTINLKLPYVKVMAKSRKRGSYANVKLKQQKTILVAEDDKISYVIIETMLAEFGTKIIWAKNGKLAVKYCKMSNDIDLVLMDLKMPVMTGFEAIEKIRKFKADIPIIALSAYTSFEDTQKAKKAGADDFIPKPVNMQTLFQKLKMYM